MATITDSTLESPAGAGRAPAAGRQMAAILVAELRNFIQLAELLPPEQVVDLARQFHELGGKSVGSASGEVITSHSESLLAAFRRGQPQQSVQQAVRTALELQVEFSALAERWQERYGVGTAVALGLHLGETVFGSYAEQAGTRVMGETVAVAELLARRARAGEIVLSDSIMGALSVSNLALDAVPLPPIELPRRPAIRIFGVLLDTRLDFT